MLSTARDTRARFPHNHTADREEPGAERREHEKTDSAADNGFPFQLQNVTEKQGRPGTKVNTERGKKCAAPKGSCLPSGAADDAPQSTGRGWGGFERGAVRVTHTEPCPLRREQRLPARHTRPVPRSLPNGTRGSPSSGAPASRFAPTFFKGKYENRKKNQKENPTRKHEHTSSTPTPLKR